SSDPPGTRALRVPDERAAASEGPGPRGHATSGEFGYSSRSRSRQRLEQHGAALAAADAFGGDALAHAEAFHRVDQMQHDAVAARAHRMAEPDCAPVHIKFVTIDAAGGAGKAEHLAAEGVVLPGGEAGKHLRCK